MMRVPLLVAQRATDAGITAYASAQSFGITAVMSNLETQLQQLAANFAHNVLAALRGASLGDIAGEASGHARTSTAVTSTPRRARAGRPAKGTRAAPQGAATSRKTGKGGRLMRRSPEAITKEVDRIVALLRGKKDGLRAEQIQAALKLRRKELPKPLAEGLAKKRLKRKGEKRATVYFAT